MLYSGKASGEKTESEWRKAKQLQVLKKQVPNHLPDEWIDYLPPMAETEIVGFSDGVHTECARFTLGPFGMYGRNKEDPHIQYRFGGTVNSREELYEKRREMFCSAYHPFVQQFTDDVRGCAGKMLKMFSSPPYLFEISKDVLAGSFDFTEAVVETPEGVEYHGFEQYSQHDGGGSTVEKWGLTPAKDQQAPKNLSHAERLNGFLLPICRGYWLKDEHLYLLDPWGLSGVFEFYSYDSDRGCCGYAPWRED